MEYSQATRESYKKPALAMLVEGNLSSLLILDIPLSCLEPGLWKGVCSFMKDFLGWKGCCWIACSICSTFAVRNSNLA